MYCIPRTRSSFIRVFPVVQPAEIEELSGALGFMTSSTPELEADTR